MSIPAELKFDVRVRERLLRAGLLSDSEVKAHLDALPDLESQAAELTLKQPALQNESDRDIVIVRTSGVRPPIAPVRNADEELVIADDDDEDDDEDVKPEPKKPVLKAKEPAEDEAGETAPADASGEAGASGEASASGEAGAADASVDKDWGEEP